MEQAALREVTEESGVDAKILEYVGDVRYKYKNFIPCKCMEV